MAAPQRYGGRSPAGEHPSWCAERHRAQPQPDLAARAPPLMLGYGKLPRQSGRARLQARGRRSASAATSTVPPLMAAALRAYPAHHPRCRMRCWAAPTGFLPAASTRSRPRYPACSIASPTLAAKATHVGTPMRPAIRPPRRRNTRRPRPTRPAAPGGGRRQPGRTGDDATSCRRRSRSSILRGGAG